MNIQSVEINHITEDPFAGLTETEMEFTPYYVCKIITDNGRYFGKGETKRAAQQDAMENLESAHANQLKEAVSKYNAEQGVYFIDC